MLLRSDCLRNRWFHFSIHLKRSLVRHENTIHSQVCISATARAAVYVHVCERWEKLTPAIKLLKHKLAVVQKDAIVSANEMKWSRVICAVCRPTAAADGTKCVCWVWPKALINVGSVARASTCVSNAAAQWIGDSVHSRKNGLFAFAINEKSIYLFQRPTTKISHCVSRAPCKFPIHPPKIALIFALERARLQSLFGSISA